MKSIIQLRKPERAWHSLLFAMLTATAVLMICSKSSFLYPMNDWVDVQCFLTMGRELMRGQIPYVDLYEQKGPVLYFVYALASVFSQKSFFGVFLLEIITVGLFLHYSGRIAELYLGKSRIIYLLQIILAVITCTSYTFRHGGGVEEMSLFFFSYGLYAVLRAVHEKRELSFREALLNGVFAGCAFWVKYTMVGFYLGLALFVLIWYLGWVQDGKKLLRTIGQFLLGFAVVSAVVVIFFWAVGGLEDLYTAYFYNNLFLYPDESELSKWAQIIDNYQTMVQWVPELTFLLCAGIVFFLLRLHKNYLDLLGTILCFAGLAVGTCWGKSMSYYALVFYAFSVFGLIGIAWLLQSPHVKELYHILAEKIPRLPQCLVAFALVCAVIYSYAASSNTYLMEYDREEMPQYQFAETINQVEDATVLNFGFLDGGFYYAADVQPTCKFFCTFNVSAPGMWQTQYEVINEKQVDFVITRKYELSHYNVKAANYTLVDTATLYFEGVDFVYYLYQVAENGMP